MKQALNNRFHTMYTPEPNTGCWLWLGSVSPGGYARVWYEGKPHQASRVSIFLDGRETPAGMLACHTCDQPSCVNPKHLYIGTAQQNMDDMVRRGRHFSPRASQTHCLRGHELSGENLRIEHTARQPTRRACVACIKLRNSKEWKQP